MEHYCMGQNEPQLTLLFFGLTSLKWMFDLSTELIPKGKLASMTRFEC